MHLGKSMPGRGSCISKDPEAGVSLATGNNYSKVFTMCQAGLFTLQETQEQRQIIHLVGLKFKCILTSSWSLGKDQAYSHILIQSKGCLFEKSVNATS